VEEFEKIYKSTYYSTLKFIAIKCHNIEDINDILQDTYIEFFNILKKKMINIEKYESYINGIANNIIKRFYSRLKIFKHEIEIEIDDNMQIADNFDLEQKIVTKENADEILKFLKEQDLITAKVFYLYFIFDMKILDIAKELELNESNVKNRLYRTIKKLRKENNYE